MPRKKRLTQNHSTTVQDSTFNQSSRGKTKKRPQKAVPTSTELDFTESWQATPTSDRPKTNPDLFTDSETTRVASALPIWEASNVLAQNVNLPWIVDPQGRLCYAKDIGDGKGAVHFWVTENIEDEYPAALAGAAALAVVESFDIRAACMHLIYAAHATQLEKPWEQELVIDDRQLEAYLGLKKRTDKNRQAKLALIEELVKQPCKITTFISWSAPGKKEITIEEGRLWHLLGTRYHYQQDINGNKELIGMTFIVRAGLWAKYFLNEEGRRSKTAYYQYGMLPRTLLESVMSIWQHHPGAARLMVWLLFKTQFSRSQPLNVQALMEIAYGEQKIEQAKQNSELRKKLANTWDDDLLTLHERGWQLRFDDSTYPLEIRPAGFGRENLQRPRGFFDRLLAARLWITPEDTLVNEVAAIKEPAAQQAQQQLATYQPELILTGSQVRALRTARGWSQRKLASLSGLSQGLISLIENNERNISAENEAVLRQTFQANA
jgi:DNA-binding XRE family transcriptional regulator